MKDMVMHPYDFPSVPMTYKMRSDLEVDMMVTIYAPEVLLVDLTINVAEETWLTNDRSKL